MSTPHTHIRYDRRAFIRAVGSSAVLALVAVAPLTWAADTAKSQAALSWSFAASKQVGPDAWSIERGRMATEGNETLLRPDTSRRVVVVSPAGLPESLRAAEEFVIGVPADAGLLRVLVQARRDARGGWITIADGKATALRATPGGIAVKRNPGSRALPIDALRVELTFRTTNPRALESIAAIVP